MRNLLYEHSWVTFGFSMGIKPKTEPTADSSARPCQKKSHFFIKAVILIIILPLTEF